MGGNTILKQMTEGFARMDEFFAKTEEGFARMDERFAKVDERFEKMDGRFEKMDGRFEKMDGRFEKMDGRFEKMDGRFEKMDGRLGGLETNQDKIIAKLFDMDARIDNCATKNELKQTENRITNILDGHTAMLRRLDHDRLAIISRLDRLEARA